MNAGQEIKNIVLVHGGFVDGSGWQGVYDHLTGDGYRVAVVQKFGNVLTAGAHQDEPLSRNSRKFGAA